MGGKEKELAHSLGRFELKLNGKYGGNRVIIWSQHGSHFIVDLKILEESTIDEEGL